MTGQDYVGEPGLSAAAPRWMRRVAPYTHSKRPSGDPARCALLVLDLQGFFCAPDSHAHLPAVRHVVPVVRALTHALADAGSPVLYTRHALSAPDDAGRMGDWWGDIVRDGTPEATLWPDLAVPDDAQVLRKTRYDAFAGTDLDRRLRAAGVTTVVLTGVLTHLCVETTARAAFALGYHVVVAADATASADEELHVGALRALAHGFAQVRIAEEIIAWRRGSEIAHAFPVSPVAVRDHDRHDVVVIGAGPAGLAAATQARRQRLSVGLFEAHQPGGLLRQANLVENYLGVGACSGADLVARFVDQAERAGAHIRPGRVDLVALQEAGGIRITLENDEVVHCRAVILATGSTPRMAGIEGEADLAHKRLFYGVRELLESTSTSGGVLVVGGGDAAADQAVQLRRRGWRPVLVVRGDRLRALALLRERVEALGIEIRHDTVLTRVEATGDGIIAAWRSRENSGTLHAHRVLVAVGRDPAVPRVVDGGGATVRDLADLAAADGVYLAGDLHRGRFRQAAMAAGDGVEAAMAVAAALETDR